MNSIARRSFLGSSSKLAVGVALGATLAACTAAETVPTIPVTLATAQQEASAILQAVGEAISLNGTPTAAETTALATAGPVVAAFTAIQPGQSYLTDAEGTVNALTPLTAFLPGGGVTEIAVQAGLGLIEALIKGLTAVPAPAPVASPAVGATPVKIIPAPIPIPVPVS